MITKTLFLFLAGLFCLNLHAANLEFQKNETVVKTLAGKELKQGTLSAGNKAVDVEVFNVWRKYKKSYTGYELFSLLDSVYGKEWRQAKQVTFIALDGYRQTAKVADMIKAAEGKTGLVAYKETNKAGFTSFTRGKKTVDPGPLYLVWTGLTEENKARHSDTLKWPYQLKTINIKF